MSSPLLGPSYRLTQSVSPVAALYARVAKSNLPVDPTLDPVTKMVDASGLTATSPATSSRLAGPS